MTVLENISTAQCSRVEWSDWTTGCRNDSMISSDTKQQFSRVACGCGRTIDPRGQRRRRRRQRSSHECPTERQTTPDNAIYMQRCAVSSVPPRTPTAAEPLLHTTRTRTRVCGRVVAVTRCRCDQRLHWPVAGQVDVTTTESPRPLPPTPPAKCVKDSRKASR